MKNFLKQSGHRAQTALEYILLLTVVAVVVFVALKPQAGNRSMLGKAQQASEEYYNTVTEVIMGKNPHPIDGGLCPPKPNGVQECACPAPAFGGQPCYPIASGIEFCGNGNCDKFTESCEPGHPNKEADLLATCYEDCGYCPNCNKCGDMIGSTCGGGTQNFCDDGVTECLAGQRCYVSNCARTCGARYKVECRAEAACACIVTVCNPAGPVVDCGEQRSGVTNCDTPCVIEAVPCP